MSGSLADDLQQVREMQEAVYACGIQSTLYNDSSPSDLDIILAGVVGSTAYGLNTKNSDLDIKGIYLLPTSKVLSI